MTDEVCLQLLTLTIIIFYFLKIIADIDELKQLRSTSVRPQVQSILDGNILQLNKKLEETKKREEIAKAKIANQASATSNLLPTIKLATYGE